MNALRSWGIAFGLALSLAGCGGGPEDTPDGGIKEVLAAPDGSSLRVGLTGVMVTYVKPPVGVAPADPAGFFVQKEQGGPALFVAIDPATLTPPPQVGDTVDFVVTGLATQAQQRRAIAITGFSRRGVGGNVAALAENITARSDVVSNVASYAGELVTVTGAFAQDLSASGTGFVSAGISTTGVPGDFNFQMRVPAVLADTLDLASACQFTVTGVPLGRTNAQAQVGPHAAADFTALSCPKPAVVSAVALTSTTVLVSFTRKIAPASVLANGTQFVFDNGLIATAAAANGTLVTVTTSPQVPSLIYTLDAAGTLTDTLGATLQTPAAASFSGG